MNSLRSVLSPEDLEQLKSRYPSLSYRSTDQTINENSDKTIYISRGLEAEDVIRLAFRDQIQNLVQENKGWIESYLNAASQLLSDRKKYFNRDFRFLSGLPEKEKFLEFRSSQDKGELLNQALSFLEEVGNSSVISSGQAIIEELYMNAVLDAPSEGLQKGIQLENPVCELHLSTVQNWLQISCSDPYGSLMVDRCLERMNEVYKNGAGRVINMDRPGGAGLGCVILFENSASLIFGIDSGVKTKVTCLVPLGIGNRQRAELKKSLHWFEL